MDKMLDWDLMDQLFTNKYHLNQIAFFNLPIAAKKSNSKSSSDLPFFLPQNSSYNNYSDNNF